MFWTAFIWGLGVSCGAACGLLAFMFLKAGADWILGNRETAETIMAYNRKSLEKLAERNELTIQMISHMDRIAETLEERTDRES